jgi:minor extracellular serine protease Vpr
LPLALLAAVAVIVIPGLTSSASGAAAHVHRGHFLRLPGGSKSGSGSALVPLALSNKRVGYILELSGKPIAAVDAASKDAGRGPLSGAQTGSLMRQLKTAQGTVARDVRRIGGTVTHTFQYVYNGIAVMIPARSAYKLSHLKGVTAVFATRTFTRANVNSVPLIGGPETWGGVPGFTGAGMKIGDIDTGLDYTHADFGGSGDVADWNCAVAHSTENPSTVNSCPGGPLSQWFGPNAPKVKGGTDLVGDCYDAGGGTSDACPDSAANEIPQPDPNPLDCNSHGTHTAGTLAGFGVLSDGSQYTGPYNADTIANNDWNVGPGMAPQASLYAIRVFGCNGSVDDATLIAAMEWADKPQHKMDVINMSLGADFGSADDPDSAAASNLAQDGVIVVSASGNAGNAPFITSSPGAGTNGIAVAANDSNAGFPAATVTLPGSGGTLTAIDANGVDISAIAGNYTLQVVPGTGGPVDTTTGSGTDSDTISVGCSVADDEAANGGNPWPSGTILVVERGICARVHKAVNAQLAGAAGVIMVNNSSDYPPFEGKITSDPDNTSFHGTVTIPFLGVQGTDSGAPSTSDAGVALLAASGGTVDLEATDPLVNPNYLDLAGFSSFGPSTGGFLKPEITAPGVSVDSAGMGTGTEALIDSGTSMATPHVAGEAALVKQAHPTWRKVEFYKDAIINTAIPANVADFSLRGAGAGEAAAYNATHTQVVASGDPIGMTSLNFGIPNIRSDYSDSEYIRVHNLGSTAATFDLNATRAEGAPHSVSFEVDGFSADSVTVNAHQTQNVKVTLDVPLSSAADPFSSWADWYGAGQFDDIGGLIKLVPASASDNGGIRLSVPYYAVPTAASAVRARLNTVKLRKNGTADAYLSNAMGGAEGFADWFSLSGTSSQSSADIGSADLLADGVQSFPAPASDPNRLDDSIAVFGLKVSKPWTNPAEDYFELDLDVNGDTVPDYAVISYDLGAFLTGSADGEAVTIVYDLHNGNFSIDFLSGAYWNGTTLELPVLFSQLCDAHEPCVSPSKPITYTTFAQDRNGGADVIDNNASFNLFQPVFSNNFEDVLDPGTTGTDTTTIDPAAWSANPQLGFLVLMQNNRGPQSNDESVNIPFTLGNG